MGKFWEDLDRIFKAFGRDLGGDTLIGATVGKSRSTNHWKDGWMVRRGLKMLEFRRVDLNCGSCFRAFFWTRFFSIFFDVGSIFGRFGRPKWKPKSIFGSFVSVFFFRVHFGIDFSSFFG